MSWHCLLELEEVSSEGICWDGERFAPSSGPNILGGYCLPDSETGSFHDSRSGTTCRPSTATPGEVESMSSRGDSLVRICHAPEKAQGSTAHDPECGSTWRESFARFDPDSSSWKTPQCSLLEGLDEFSETWPRWGMMRRGECWELSTWEHRTSGTGSGLWLSTPTVNSAHNSSFPPSQINRDSLVGDVMRNWPTPRTKGMCGGSGAWEQLKQATTIEEARAMGAGNGGQLNPPWVEWLMGWPIEWTASKPLETDKFQQWRQAHSAFSPDGLE